MKNGLPDSDGHSFKPLEKAGVGREPYQWLTLLGPAERERLRNVGVVVEKADERKEQTLGGTLFERLGGEDSSPGSAFLRLFYDERHCQRRIFIIVTARRGAAIYMATNALPSADAKPAAKLSPPAGPHAAESLGETLKEKRHSS
ncbi:Uncharacterized protein DBV15_07601 [Temnothorax longispinosus]|uniref:Uncharacterized protein n=1 Tax=Temnothorax longispinosus TaxID=300112 RepID=A0A4V3SA72_9HYME|nr:Uncharacterized protein DBV15_07601 [Temnothorax longispinosus]